MSRLLDPTICPDCRAPLDARATCTGCGLRLEGPLAPRLWETIVAADGLVRQLRAAQAAPAPAPVPVPVQAPVITAPTLPPARPVVAPARPRRRMPAMSVPVVLLSLGALCLLVAAFVFVVVTWSLMGITGRTLVLLGVTGLMAALASLAVRKDLRGAAESLWLVVAGMLALDLAAARSAGLAGLDVLDGRDAATLTGVVLLALGAGVARWTSHRPVTALWGMQGVAALGAATATVSGAWLADETAIGLAVAVPLLVGAAYVLRGLPVLTASLAGLGALSWLGLVLAGVVRLGETDGWTRWWSQFRGWPLLAAAAYAGAGALVRRAPLVARQVLAGATLLLLAVVAVAPVVAPDSVRQSLTRSAVVLVLAVLVVVLRDRTWTVPAGLLAAIGAAVLAVPAVVAPAQPLLGLGYAGTAPWSHLIAAVVAVAALRAVCRLLPDEHRDAVAEAVLAGGAAVIGSAVAISTMALRPGAGVVTAVLVASTLAAGGLTWALRRRGPASVGTSVVGGAGAAYLLALSLLAASSTWTATAVAATVLPLATAAWFADADRRGPAVAPVVLAALAVLLGAVGVRAWVAVLDGPSRWAALVVVAYAALLALVAHAAARRPWSRVSLEVAAAVVAFAALGLTGSTQWQVLLLATTGLVAAVTAVRHVDRVQVGWGAVAVAGLAAATALGGDVAHAELYVVPAALVLLVGGVLRDRSDALVGAGLAHGVVVLAVVSGLGLGETVVASAGLLVVVVLYVVLESARRALTAPPAAVLAALFAAVALLGWADVLDVAQTTSAVVLAALAAVVLLGSRPASRQEHSRIGFEVAAVLVTLVALTTSGDEATGGLVLLLTGTAAAALAAWHRDRVLVGWVAVLLVGAGAALQVSVDVRAPELYLVPSLVLLLASGVLRRGWQGGTGTLGSGVVLGTIATTLALVGDLDDRLVVGVATAVALVLATTWVRADRIDAPVESPAAALAAAYAGLVALLGWTSVLEVADTTLAASLAVYAGALLVVAHPAARRTSSRLALEASGALLTVVALAITPVGTTQPMVLTIVGTAVAVVAVSTRDRFWAGWVSTALLGAATVLRLVDDVRLPELYTLPAAVLLLAAGGWRLRSDPESGSLQALGSGLTLALVPSLLLALDEPVSARGLLVGIGAAALLAVGVARRLSAPFAFGAATIALLAVRHLGPAADSVPRWVSLGLLGLALLAVGVTWEARLRDLRAARAYVAALR